MSLIYRIDVLGALKEKGYNTNKMRKEKLLSEGAIQSLREQRPISWDSIARICAMLNCQPGYFIEFVPYLIETEQNPGAEDNQQG